MQTYHLTVKRVALALFLLSCILQSVHAQDSYQDITKKFRKFYGPTRTISSVEQHSVHEYFSYACGICYSAEPYVARLLQMLPSEIEFKRFQINFGRESDSFLQAAHGAALATNMEQLVHPALFNLYQVQGRELKSVADVVNFLDGLDNTRDWKKVVVSTEVSLLTQQILTTQRTERIASTPVFIVDGRYRVRWSPDIDPDSFARLLIALSLTRPSLEIERVE